MNYKVQFKAFDPVANATKVSIKQDYPYRVFEESLPNNRMGDEESTLVDAVLNLSYPSRKSLISLLMPIRMLFRKFKNSLRKTKRKMS